VADQHDAIEVEALPQLLDLWRQGLRIAGVTVEHLNGDRTTIRGAEQAVDDLQGPLLAVTAVATLGQRTAASFHVARRDVVEDQHAIGQMAFAQDGFDGRLAHQQPVECGVEFVVIDVAETERFAEAGGCGGGREGAGRGQLRDGVEDAANEHRQDEVAAAIAVGAEDALEADLAGDADCRRDVAVRQAADDGEGVMSGGDNSATLEHAAQAFDRGGRPVGEVAERALTKPAVLAVSLAQEDGGRGIPIRNGFDIHGQRRADSVLWYKSRRRDYMATVWMLLRPFCQDFRQFGSIGEREARPRATSAESSLTTLPMPSSGGFT